MLQESLELLSKSRQKKCKKGLHEYKEAESEYVYTRQGRVKITFKRCMYCGKRLN